MGNKASFYGLSSFIGTEVLTYQLHCIRDDVTYDNRKRLSTFGRCE
jgi:hypothetical protein